MYPLPHLRAPSGKAAQPVVATLACVAAILALVAGLAMLGGAGGEQPMLQAGAAQAVVAAPLSSTAAAPAPAPSAVSDSLPEEMPPTF